MYTCRTTGICSYGMKCRGLAYTVNASYEIWPLQGTKGSARESLHSSPASLYLKSEEPNSTADNKRTIQESKKWYSSRPRDSTARLPLIVTTYALLLSLVGPLCLIETDVSVPWVAAEVTSVQYAVRIRVCVANCMHYELLGPDKYKA